MQHRWNSHCLTNLGKAWAAVNFCRLRRQKPCLCAGNCIASRGENNDIVLDQLFYYSDVPLIQRGSGIVSPNHAADTSYPAIDNIIVKGRIRCPERASEVVVDRLVAEARH